MTHPDTKPEALRLADRHQSVIASIVEPQRRKFHADTAACLRRLHAECESLRTKLAEARAEAEALRADARRYLFLRNKADPDNGDPYVTIHKTNSWGNWFNTHEYCEALDAAIDTAMKEGG